MKVVIVFLAALLAAHDAKAATPYNLDISRIAVCKAKYSVRGTHTLLVVYQAFDKDGQFVTEFGNERGQPIDTAEASQTIRQYLLDEKICPEIRMY